METKLTTKNLIRASKRISALNKQRRSGRISGQRFVKGVIAVGREFSHSDY
jgi:hypothetical protein